MKGQQLFKRYYTSLVVREMQIKITMRTFLVQWSDAKKIPHALEQLTTRTTMKTSSFLGAARESPCAANK